MTLTGDAVASVRSASRRARASPATQLAGLAALILAAYIAGAEMSWPLGGGVGIAFFPPAGVTVAAMLLSKRSRWPLIAAAIVLAETAVDVRHGLSLPGALGLGAANALEPTVGATATLALSKGVPDLRDRADLARFLAGACLAGPLAGGIIGAAVASLNSGTWWPANVLQWCAGDGVAVLVIGSPILLWRAERHLVASRWAELTLAAAAVAGLSVLTFLVSSPPALLLLPILTWAAFRLGHVGVAVCGTVFALVSNYMTAAGRGPFAHLPMPEYAAVSVAQAYIAVLVLVGLIMAQEISGRADAHRQRRAALADTARADARRAAAEIASMVVDAPSPLAVAELVVGAARDRLGADHAVINVLGEDQRSFVQLASTGLPPVVAEVAERFTVESDAPGPLAVRRRGAVYRSDRQTAPEEFAEKRRVEKVVGVRAVAALPLLTEAGPQGYLDLWWTTPHEFTTAEREYLDELASAASRAMERARLRQARQREQERLQTLSELARLLSAAVTPEDIGRVASSQLRRQAGVRAVTLGLISSDGTVLEWVTIEGFPERLREAFRPVPLTRRSAATDALRSGVPVIIRSVDEYRRRYPETAGVAAAFGAASFLSWPLTVGDSQVGALGFLWAEPQQLDAGQLAFASAVSRLVADALVRARRFADEHAVAAVLQEAVMPKAHADLPGILVGSCYQPAGSRSGVGGDWYDAMPLPSGGSYLAVGDVVGHGLAAAEDMTQLRNAGRALAIQGLPPARLLAELNTVTAHVTHGQFATMAVAVLDPVSGSLRYSSAGHPPALIREARSGEVRELRDGRGPVLGVFSGASYQEGRAVMEAGDIVVLYSDGLIERRRDDLDAGIARVVRQLEHWPVTEPLGPQCERLAAALAPQPHDDDVCVLAASIERAPRRHPEAR